MTFTSISDLSRSFQLRRDTTRIKTDLNRWTSELSSGVSADLVGKLKGNFQPLSGIERGLSRVEGFSVVIAEHRLVTSSLQTSLGNLRSLGEVRGALLTVPDTADTTLVQNAGYDALSRFSSVIGNLNTQVGGRSIFAGVTTDQPAIADADTILAAIETELSLAGAATATDVATVVTTWFGSGGGFDSIGYIGGTQMTAGPRLSDSETAPPPITAEDVAIRDFLAAMAMGGLLGRGVLPGDEVEQGRLARLAGETLFAVDSQLVELQASIGAVEAQVERASVEVATLSDGLQLARSELIEIDPFDAAVSLQNSETQLQALYSITARLSRLSLAEYL